MKWLKKTESTAWPWNCFQIYIHLDIAAKWCWPPRNLTEVGSFLIDVTQGPGYKSPERGGIAATHMHVERGRTVGFPAA
jgi:hypothetical protein